MFGLAIGIKTLAVGAGVSVITAGLIFGAGYYKGQAACVEAQYAEANKWLRAEIARRDARTQADNAQREADRAERDRLAERIKDLSDELEDPDRECLGPADTDRLRRLWRQP